MKSTVAVLLSFVLVLTSCYGPPRVRKVDPVSVHRPGKELLVGVTTKAGEDVTFDPLSGSIRDDVIHAQVRGAAWQLPVAAAQTLWIERRELRKTATIGLVAGLVVVGMATLIGVVAAVKGSCPFVYSWNGSEYVFDAEPYGGAISRGLQRDDYAELRNLKEQDGMYRLLLTNEVDETQYTDLLELWVVDHSPNTIVAADERGKLYTLSNPQPPVSARDAAGHDLLPWLVKNDRLIWEPAAEPASDGSLRQDIVLSFPKPPGAKHAKLLVNAATGLWGSYLVREILELRGRSVDQRYRELDRQPSARNDLRAWNLREELFMLKVYVEEPAGWVERGLIPGGGPIRAPARVAPLDISAVHGSELRIRIRPPLGSWALNSFAVDFTEDSEVPITPVRLSRARDRHGVEVSARLAKSDQWYYEMPALGDRAYVTFQAPPLSPHKARTIFLHSSGYYTLHLHSKGEANIAELNRLRDIPGWSATFSMLRYTSWKNGEAQGTQP